MFRRRFLVPLAALLALAAAAPVFFGSGSQAQSDEDVVAIANPAPSASAELRVWQSVRDPLDGIWISARPDADSRWTTQRLQPAMREGGGWRIEDLTVDALGGEIDLRLWQDPSTLTRLYLSARPAGGSWDEYGTQRIRLDERSRSGRYRYGDVSLALAWPDSQAPAPGSAAVTLCIPDGLETETLSARVWRSVAAPRRYYLSTRPDTDARWSTQRLTLAETGEDGWSAASLTVDAGDADFELRLWQRGNALALSARVAGTPWDEYGTRSVTLNRRSASGNYHYANREIMLTLPESEPPDPGAPARTWDCPETGAGGPGGGTGPGEPEATPTPDPDNTRPWADAGDDQTVSVGDTVILDGSGSADPDEDAITYAWTQTGGTYTGTVALTGENTDSPSFTVESALSGQTVEFTLTVTDEHGLSMTDTVMITVRTQQPSSPPGGAPPGNITQPNQAPTADAGDDVTVALGVSIILSGSDSSDPDGDTLTYTWAQDTTTTDTDYYTDSVNLTAVGAGAIFPLPEEAMGKKIRFTLTVEDPGGLTDTDEVIVTVTNNQPPTASISSPSPSDTFTPGATVTLTGSGTDPEGDTVSYAWSASWNKGGGNSTQITVPNHENASTSLTVPASALAGHTILINLAVLDAQDPKALDTATVTFNVVAELTTSNVTATGATLTIAGYKAAWWYKSASTSCTAVAANTASATVSGLSPGTTYTFKAYSDSACTTANALATAPLFTTDAQLTAGSVTATGATLTLAGHSGQWWYKSTTTGQKDCADAGSGATKVLTGLDAGTSYTYSAYSDSACTSANLLATANTFKTGVSLAAGAPTATTVTLTLAGHDGQWWYKKRVDTSCRGSVAAGTATKTLTGLTPGEPYTWTVHSDSSCRTELARTWFTMLAPTLTSSGVTDNSATLTLDSEWKTADGDWHYKYTSPSGGTCSGAQSALTASVGSLTPGTAYTFTAYADSGCSTVIDAAPAFTTLALTTRDVSATRAELTIAGHTGDWYYKSSTTGQNTCAGPVSDDHQLLTGLAKGTPYTFTAYSDATCTPANRLATAASFTTLSPAFTSSAITKYSAKLTLSNWNPHLDGQWYYKSATSGATTCTAVSGASEATVTSLTHNTAYVFTAYSDSGCTTGNEIATAPSFTTTANTAPVVTLSDGHVTAGNSYTPVVTVTDDNCTGANNACTATELSALSWQWNVPAATITGATTASPSIAFPAAAPLNSSYRPTVTVTDEEGGTTSASATLVVKNRAPNAVLSGAPYSAPAGRQVNVDGLSSRDPDTDLLSYSWAKTGGTYTGTVNFGGGTIYASTNFTVPSNATAGQTIEITLTVNDGKGGTDTDSATVTVGPWSTNWPPTANAGADQEFWMGQNANNRVTITGSGSDPDTGDTLSYSWAVASGPYAQYVTLVQNSSKPQEVYFDWPSQAPLNYGIEIHLTVCDNHGACNTDEMLVTRISGLTVNVGADGADIRRRSDATAVTFTRTATVSNPDGFTVTLDWEVVLGENADPGELPDGVTISGEATKAITVSFAGEDALTSAAAGTYSIGLKATASGQQGTPPVDWLTIELVANQAPTVNSIYVSGRTLDGNATDPDGPDTALVHTWSAPANSGITFTRNNTTSDQTDISGGTSGATVTIKLRVTDPHGGTGERTVSVTIP